jgi:GT2 family glycosyltransferase
MMVRILNKLKKILSINGKNHIYDIDKWYKYLSKKRDYHFILDENTPKVSVIILSYKNLLLTKICLKSIYTFTSYSNFEIIVVDNASNDGTKDWLINYQKSHSNLKLILNTENKGFAGGNNQAAKIANGEYLIFLNNDTIVSQNWIEGLLDVFKTYPKAGIVGPVTNAIGNEACIKVDYNRPNEFIKYINKRQLSDLKVFEIRMVAFYCAMTTKKLFIQLDGLDERYSVGMFEDDDLCVNYRKNGYNIYCTEKVFIHHFHGGSFKKLDPNLYSKIFEENRIKYEEKWGFKWEPYNMRIELK